MPKLRKIKDPLYGYVYYSQLEEKIISNPLVLRLHHIRQNGAAFLTYPSMRVHRFEHSLGAMHVAGLLFKNAADFSDEPTIDDCLREIISAVTGTSVTEIIEELEKASQHKGKSKLAFLAEDNFYKYNGFRRVDDPPTFARLIVFQSVRIAALVHDIGHPPFSHTFETALKQVKRKKYTSHEKVGLELFKLIVDDLKKSEDHSWYFFAKHVLGLATAVIDKHSEHSWRVPALSDIISSGIDADRLDYVRRDSLSSGSSTNAYDLGRLIDAVRFQCVTSQMGKVLKPVMTTDALSTIEAFFNVRFHLYRWMLWHHNVVRHNLALILCIKMMAQVALESSAVAALAQDVMSLALETRRRGEYWRFTDSFLLDRLATMLICIEKQKKRQSTDMRLLHRYLRTFLHREKDHLRPLWKRPDEYVAFGENVTEERQLTEGAKALNERLTSAYLKFVRSTAGNEQVDVAAPDLFDRFEAEHVEYLSGAFCTSMEGALSADLVRRKVRVRAYYLAKFRPGPGKLELHTRDSSWDKPGYDIGVLSPSIRALTSAWEGLPHLWLFIERLPEAGVKLPGEGDLRPADLYEEVGRSLKRFLEEVQ